MSIRMKSLKNSLVYASRRVPKDVEFDARGETDAKVLEFAKAAVRVKPAAAPAPVAEAPAPAKGRGTGGRRSSSSAAASAPAPVAETSSGSAEMIPENIPAAETAAAPAVPESSTPLAPRDGGIYQRRDMRAEDE
jgi:hypothetical protein